MKFDKRFFNFEDPEVFEQMTGKDMIKHWKETYGHDFVAYGTHSTNERKNISEWLISKVVVSILSILI